MVFKRQSTATKYLNVKLSPPIIIIIIIIIIGRLLNFKSLLRSQAVLGAGSILGGGQSCDQYVKSVWTHDHDEFVLKRQKRLEDYLVNKLTAKFAGWS